MPLPQVTETPQLGVIGGGLDRVGPASVPPPPPPDVQQIIVQRFLTAILSAFSERVVFMLHMLFTAGGLVLAWFLWSRVLPSPTVPQLIGLGMYSVFFLALEYVRRR